MFIQNTSANLRIKIDSEVNVLEQATSVIVKIRRRNYKISKEAIIVNKEEQIAICYLTAEDLCMPGTYDYNVEVQVGKRIIKSGMGSFYVSPAVNFYS